MYLSALEAASDGCQRAHHRQLWKPRPGGTLLGRYLARPGPAGGEGGREAGGGAGPGGLRRAGARRSVAAARGAARLGGPPSLRVTGKSVAVPHPLTSYCVRSLRRL